MASLVQLVRGCLERFTVKLGRLWCHGILWCTWRDRCHRRGCTSPKFSANRSHLANPHSTLCLRATPAADPYRLGHCHDTEFASRFTVIFGAITLGLVFFSSRQSSEG